MPRSYLKYIPVVMLVACLSGGPAAFGATRLGLHVTQEELNIWRQRMTDNVNGMNGFTFQSIYQNRILADANLFRSQSHPGGDGFWIGYTGPGCLWLDPNNEEANEPHGARFWRGNGADLGRSAFVYLLTGDTSYADPVKAELLNEIVQPGADWTNINKFCSNQDPPSGFLTMTPFEYVPWLYRLMLGYDYLNAGGYTGFTALQKQQIENWFIGAAVYFHATEIKGYSYGCYLGIFNQPQDLSPIFVASPCNDPTLLLYFNGPILAFGTQWFYNQGTPALLLNAAVGALTNNASYKLYAKQAVTAFLTVGLMDNGAFTDFSRWDDCRPECPGSMWGHGGGAYGGLTVAIDLLARTGDTSLYTLTTPTQAFNTAGATVGWQTMINLWAQMANKTVLFYGTTNPADLTFNRLLSWDTDAGTNTGNYYDFTSMAANLFYNNATIRTAMTRTSIGANTTQSPGGCNDAQYGGCFSGVIGWWPDLPFMYGDMEGRVNPFVLGGGPAAPPVLRLVR
jgi:hypothetical protein